MPLFDVVYNMYNMYNSIGIPMLQYQHSTAIRPH